MSWGVLSLGALALLLAIHGLRQPLAIPAAIVGGAIPVLVVLGFLCGLLGLRSDPKPRLARLGTVVNGLFVFGLFVVVPLVFR